MKTIMIMLLLAVLICSCSLPRNNPLDPLGNPDIEAPKMITGLSYNTSPAGAMDKYVYLIWNWDPPVNDNAYGFKIYRSMGFFAEYEVVDTVATFYYNHINVQPGDYYYRVSAYIHYGYDQPLEGRASDPRFVRVLP